jgi:glycogen debranching enzyme
MRASRADHVSTPVHTHSSERRGLLPRFTLRDGDTFLLADALGDIQGSDDGLFTTDTRVLSRFEIEIAGKLPSLLGAAISQDNTLFTAQLTNRPLPALGEASIPQGVIHIERSRFLRDACLHERLRFTNYSGQPATVPLRLSFAADFADIFEVQGHRRTRRGELLEPEVSVETALLAYRGLDERVRSTQIRFSALPLTLSAHDATFSFEIPRAGVAELFLEIGPPLSSRPSAARFDFARDRLVQSMRQRLTDGAAVESSGRLFNEWIDKSRSDLALLTTTLPTGPYPYAGIPWFATQFGRDGIITALQTLWLNPALAAGVLRFLAHTQAHEESAFRDAEPGKIMHEMRRGEMAVLHEVPFEQYYGGVDTTPLFVMLAAAYEERTGDRALVDEIWPNLLEATAWIERRLDRSASGFLDYARGAQSGLVNQGWKDSHDSISHADGRLPRGPVAVVEVQGYAHAALRGMATLAGARNRPEQASAWNGRAERLAGLIEERFWIPDMDFYALAIDGENELCRVRASNAGHLLYCGIPGAERGARVAHQLLSESFSSGWGIRTLAKGEVRFNPMSYHNGAIWPHDTSLCAAGIARYCGTEFIVPLLSELFEAANQFAMHLPELYCGFTRYPGQGPTPYPVACLPQAWASGALFMLLQAALGIRIDGRQRAVHVSRPVLPIGIQALNVRDIHVGDSKIELRFQRLGNRIEVKTLSPGGGVQVLAQV